MQKTKRSKRTKYGVDAVLKKVRGIEDVILKGSLLAIDPSCISTSSLPGWALYKNSKLVSSGVISGIDPTSALEKRLQFIGKYCREFFDEPDVLVLEHIQMGGRISMQSTIRATGAILGSFECEHVISILPLSWQKAVLEELNLTGNTDYQKYKEYKEKIKSDEEDAKWIGRGVIKIVEDSLK